MISCCNWTLKFRIDILFARRGPRNGGLERLSSLFSMVMVLPLENLEGWSKAKGCWNVGIMVDEVISLLYFVGV